MAWITICTANPRNIQQRVRLQDSSRALIFTFVIVAACISLLAVILVLREHKALQKIDRLHLSMAVLAVIESWLLIHTVFTLRYAHVFYRLEQEADVEGSGRGLIFPGGDNPDYEDFAYFSFVIGMTCQVSDVNITSRFMRRLALLHGLLSFAFNTAILALSINIIPSGQNRASLGPWITQRTSNWTNRRRCCPRTHCSTASGFRRLTRSSRSGKRREADRRTIFLSQPLLEEIRAVTRSLEADPLKSFGEACRAELQSIRAAG